ncbi:hypothetical protein DL770_008854 [Monosporascus sp. CRB-9-2]|nr:hypothetical protein DL770_008854 [Monosporascus sp. CRB-9-2]
MTAAVETLEATSMIKHARVSPASKVAIGHQIAENKPKSALLILASSFDDSESATGSVLMHLMSGLLVILPEKPLRNQWPQLVKPRVCRLGPVFKDGMEIWDLKDFASEKLEQLFT